MEIKMSEVPLDIENAHEKLNKFGVRITEILKRINCLNREKYIFNVIGAYTSAITVHLEVIDNETGALLKLQHGRTGFRQDMTDEEIARGIYIMVCQLAVHETAENFRLDGKILYNPHDAGRNGILFKAVELSASPTPEQDIAMLLPPVPKKNLWQRIRNK